MKEAKMSIAEEFELRPIDKSSNLEGISKSKIKNAQNNRVIPPDISVNKLDEALEIQARYWGWYDDEDSGVWRKSHLSFLRNPQKSSPNK